MLADIEDLFLEFGRCIEHLKGFADRRVSKTAALARLHLGISQVNPNAQADLPLENEKANEASPPADMLIIRWLMDKYGQLVKTTQPAQE